jgi:hypothetical protein
MATFDVVPLSRLARGRQLVLVSSSDVAVGLLRRALDELEPSPLAVDVVLPAVLPAALPVSGCPPALATRLELLRDVAAERLRLLRRPGSVEIVPCHSVRAVLVAAIERHDVGDVTIVGRCGPLLRRAARRRAGPRLVEQRRRGRRLRLAGRMKPA